MPNDDFFPYCTLHDDEAERSCFPVSFASSFDLTGAPLPPFFVHPVPASEGLPLDLPEVTPLPLLPHELEGDVPAFDMLSSYHFDKNSHRGGKRVARSEESGDSLLTSAGAAKNQRLLSTRQVTSGDRHDASSAAEDLPDSAQAPTSSPSADSWSHRSFDYLVPPLSQVAEESLPPDEAPSAATGGPYQEDVLLSDYDVLIQLGYSVRRLARIAHFGQETDPFKAVRINHDAMTGFGFKIEETARIVARDGGTEILQTIADNYASLREHGFGKRDIIRMSSHGDGARKLTLVKAFLSSTPGFREKAGDITDIVVLTDVDTLWQQLEKKHRQRQAEEALSVQSRTSSSAIQKTRLPVHVEDDAPDLPEASPGSILPPDVLCLGGMPLSVISMESAALRTAMALERFNANRLHGSRGNPDGFADDTGAEFDEAWERLGYEEEGNRLFIEESVQAPEEAVQNMAATLRESAADGADPLPMPASEETPIAYEDIVSLNLFSDVASQRPALRSPENLSFVPLSGSRDSFFHFRHPVSVQCELETLDQDYLAAMSADNI